MEVREYTTRYITDEQVVDMREVGLYSARTFTVVSALMLIWMTLSAILPSESLIVKACSILSIETAAGISVYAVCKIIIAITHPKAIGGLQAIAYDDHMVFISKNIHGDKTTSNIKYENIGAVAYNSKSQLLIINNTENEEGFRVTLAGKRKETRKFVANVFSTTPISIEIK